MTTMRVETIGYQPKMEEACLVLKFALDNGFRVSAWDMSYGFVSECNVTLSGRDGAEMRLRGGPDMIEIVRASIDD